MDYIFPLQNQEVTFGESEKMLKKSQTSLGSSVSEFTQEKKTEELLNPGIMVPAMTGNDRSSQIKMENVVKKLNTSKREKNARCCCGEC